MPTIAAILFMVAYNMCQWRTFVRLTKTAPKSDIAVLVLTFFLTVIFDLVVAIEIGMLLSCLLFMKRMSDETGVRSWLYVEEVEEQKRKEQEVRKAKKAGKELSVEEAQLLAAAAEDEEAAMKEQVCGRSRENWLFMRLQDHCSSVQQTASTRLKPARRRNAWFFVCVLFRQLTVQR